MTSCKSFTNNGLVLLTLLMLIIGVNPSSAQINTYTFSQSTVAYTPLSGATIVATATGSTAPANLDNVIYTVADGTIPFPFTFNSINYTGFKISTNGFITFGTTAPSTSNTNPISSTALYSGAIAAFGRDMIGNFSAVDASLNAVISYATTGVAPNRKFIIEWKNFRPNGTTPVFNFQIRLNETSNIAQIAYGPITLTGVTNSTCQVGIRGADNTFATNVLNRTLASGQLWANTLPGTLNSSTCAFTATAGPTNGLVFSFGPSLCPPPNSLSFINSTTTTTTLRWKPAGGGGTYVVEYGAPGFVQGTGTIVNTVDTFINVTGLTASTQYQYYVKQNCTGSGNGFSTVAGPRNFATGGPGEECSTAFTYSVYPDSASSVALTVASGVSQNGPISICGDGSSNLPDDDVWVKFIAPANGQKVVIQTAAGTNNDWIMEVWSGCPGAGGTIVDCSDDQNAFMPEVTLCQTQYTAGQTYYIRLWTYSNGASGNCTLKIFEKGVCVFPPANDECTNAITLQINQPLTCPGNNLVFSTSNATPSGGPATTCDFGTIRDVWFKFNTSNFGNFSITFNSITATSLKAAIFFDCNGFEVQCFNPAQGTVNVNGLNPVAEYILRVWSDTLGDGTFDICLADLCDEPTAALSGSTSICAGGSAQLRVDLTGIPPWNFVYTNGTSNFTIATAITPYIITVNPSVTTYYNLVSVNSQYCSGTTSGSSTVTIIPPPVVTLSPLGTVCANQIISLSGGSPVGGTYSGTGVSGGQFNASVAGIGSTPITYTYGIGNGCQRTAVQPISVISAPSITSFSPTLSPVGTLITVTGNNFTGTTTVKFNTTIAPGFTIVNNTTITVNVPVGASTGLITVINSNGCSGVSAINFVVGNPVTTVNLNLKVFLEGFYISGSGGQLNAVLDPFTFPNICDSITVDFVLSTDVNNIVATRNGTISTMGNGLFGVPSTMAGLSYYIVVRHRNSIETWSANPVFLSLAGVSYDFSNQQTKAFGNNMANLGLNHFGVYSSDVNQDGFVDASDLADIDNDASAFNFGYLVTDVNGDSFVDATDLAYADNNATLFISLVRP